MKRNLALQINLAIDAGHQANERCTRTHYRAARLQPLLQPAYWLAVKQPVILN